MANTNSIVDYLKSTGRDSSYGARSSLARDYGISNYTGSADQNIKLLNSIRSGNASVQQNIPQQAPSPIQEQAPLPQQPQNVNQPSLTVNSADLVNRPLVQAPLPQYNAPKLPEYTPPPAPVYTPPQQYDIPEPPKLNTIDFGQAPTIQSQDEILQNIQNRIKPLSDQEIANLKQGVDAGFAPVEAEQRRTNDTRDLFARAAAAQRGDLGFGTSELTYTGLANTQQAGVDALARLQASKVAEQNARVQAANESNRNNQLELLNQANQYRQQQQQEFQTYVNNQMAANDAALQQYRIKLENTRYANDQARQNALDQYNAAKDQNDLMRQRFQDQLQSYEVQRNVAKDTLSMISELGAKDISSLGDLSSIEVSIGLPPGYVNALQQTKLAAENAKNNAQIAEVYNQGVQLAMSLPEGQSFSFKNPDGSTTTFTGTKPNEFQVINNAQGVWRVNKDTGEMEQIQSFGGGSSGGGKGNSSARSSSSYSGSSSIPLEILMSQPQQSSLGSGVSSGLSGGIGAALGRGQTPQQPAAKPAVDISKFDPQIQLIINGQTTFDKLSVKDRARLAGQLNQAAQLGLLPGQGESGVLNEKQQAALDKTPEVKKLTTLSDFKSKLNRYNTLVDTYGIQLTGSNKAKLDQAYADLKISYKNAAELGALAGPDLDILMEAIKPATGLGGLKQKISGGGTTGITNSITQMIGNVNEDAKKNIDLLNARNPAFKNSEYVNTLISPFKSNTGNSQADSLRNKYNY